MAQRHRLSDKQAIRLALLYAIDWEKSCIGAYTEQREHMTEEYKAANPLDPEILEMLDQWRANIRGFRRCLDRYFGGGMVPLPSGEPITLQELLRRVEEDHQQVNEDVPREGYDQ